MGDHKHGDDLNCSDDAKAKEDTILLFLAHFDFLKYFDFAIRICHNIVLHFFNGNLVDERVQSHVVDTILNL